LPPIPIDQRVSEPGTDGSRFNCANPNVDTLLIDRVHSPGYPRREATAIGVSAGKRSRRLLPPTFRGTRSWDDRSTILSFEPPGEGPSQLHRRFGGRPGRHGGKDGVRKIQLPLMKKCTGDPGVKVGEGGYVTCGGLALSLIPSCARGTQPADVGKEGDPPSMPPRFGRIDRNCVLIPFGYLLSTLALEVQVEAAVVLRVVIVGIKVDRTGEHARGRKMVAVLERQGAPQRIELVDKKNRDRVNQLFVADLPEMKERLGGAGCRLRGTGSRRRQNPVEVEQAPVNLGSVSRGERIDRRITLNYEANRIMKPATGIEEGVVQGVATKVVEHIHAEFT
jgi:hypothetical protein